MPSRPCALAGSGCRPRLAVLLTTVPATVTLTGRTLSGLTLRTIVLDRLGTALAALAALIAALAAGLSLTLNVCERLS